MLSRFDASFIAFFGTCSESLLSFYLDTLLLSWLCSRVRQKGKAAHLKVTQESQQIPHSRPETKATCLETRTCVKVLLVGRSAERLNPCFTNFLAALDFIVSASNIAIEQVNYSFTAVLCTITKLISYLKWFSRKHRGIVSDTVASGCRGEWTDIVCASCLWERLVRLIFLPCLCVQRRKPQS